MCAENTRYMGMDGVVRPVQGMYANAGSCVCCCDEGDSQAFEVRDLYSLL